MFRYRFEGSIVVLLTVWLGLLAYRERLSHDERQDTD